MRLLINILKVILLWISKVLLLNCWHQKGLNQYSNPSNFRFQFFYKQTHKHHNQWEKHSIDYKKQIGAYYISHHGEINSSYHYQVLCKEITGIDIKTVETINESYPSGSVVNDLFDIQGLINMKEELSRSPQPEKFPNDRYHEKMALSQFNSRTRSMVALPLLFSIRDINSLPVSECTFIIDVTFADGTTLTTSTGVIKCK